MTCKPINPATGVALGVAIGVGIGVATGDLGTWIAVGAAIGYAIGSNQQCGAVATKDAQQIAPRNGK